MNHSVKRTEEEIKAVNSIVVDADVWLQTAWDMKAANCIDKAILEQTTSNPHKLSKEEKRVLIRDSVLKTRKEKDEEEGA